MYHFISEILQDNGIDI